AMINDGFSATSGNVAGWMSYLKNTLHLNYFITKAGNGDNQYTSSNSPYGANTTQYTTALVSAAHTAGLKIFPYFYIYGDHSDVSPSSHHVANEAATFNTVLNTIGGDAAVFDIESEYGD